MLPPIHTTVDAQERRRNATTERAQEHDGTSLLGEHARQHDARHLDHGGDVDLDDALVDLLTKLAGGSIKELGELVVDSDVVD